MPLFMHKHIERVVNVKDDGNCVFRAVSDLFGKGEENHFLVRRTLLKELMSHREFYTMLYVKKERFDALQDDLSPCVRDLTPFSKWMCFPEMGHLIASAYDMVCIDLTRYGFSENFFLLRGGPPKDPSEYIMCIGWLSESLYFVEVYLKMGCHVPNTSLKWTTHFTKEEETWPNQFLEMMEKFTKLSELGRESNKENSKEESVVDLCADASFNAF